MDRKTLGWTVGLVVVITAGIIRFVLWDESRTSQRLTQEAEGFTALATQWYDSSAEQNVARGGEELQGLLEPR
ncbi:MAG: hypothetical protein H0V56_09095 [Chthoniobacterales bacterium]|nr:hypothetical protein [Chthoniobacterales bacterium]